MRMRRVETAPPEQTLAGVRAALLDLFRGAASEQDPRLTVFDGTATADEAVDQAQSRRRFVWARGAHARRFVEDLEQGRPVVVPAGMVGREVVDRLYDPGREPVPTWVVVAADGSVTPTDPVVDRPPPSAEIIRAGGAVRG